MPRGAWHRNHRWLHLPGVYKYVHSLHHRSYNPGVWSGFAMHPIEHATYLTRAALPLFFTQHPVRASPSALPWTEFDIYIRSSDGLFYVGVRSLQPAPY